MCSLIAAVHLRKFAAEVCRQMHLVPQEGRLCSPACHLQFLQLCRPCLCLNWVSQCGEWNLSWLSPSRKVLAWVSTELLIQPVGKMTSVEKVTFVKEQSRRWFEWTLLSSWATPPACVPLSLLCMCSKTLSRTSSLGCEMPGILLEWISVTPVPVAWLWQGCWMQTSSHNLQAQATLPCKSQLGTSFSRGFAGSCDWQEEQSPTDPAQNVDCKIHSASIVSVWDLPSSCLHCFVLSPVMRWRWISWKKNGFSHQLCVQLKQESWASPEGTIWYCPCRAQDTVFCRASSPSFSKHPKAFLARSPFLVSLPHLALLCVTMSQRWLLLKEGSCISPATSYTAAFTASGSKQGL